MQLRRIAATAAMVVMIGACDARDGGVVPDAPPIVDAPRPDAEPFICMATGDPTITPGPACLALAPVSLQGSTPFGELDVDLAYFAAGDCIDHAMATIAWIGACQEQVLLQFPYPTTSDGMKRRVATSFDPSSARFELRPFQEAARDVTTSIHVDVVNWQEGDGVHSIDITVSFTDPSFMLPPLHIAGTFCDWPYYVC
jgi:hypothetical protein